VTWDVWLKGRLFWGGFFAFVFGDVKGFGISILWESNIAGWKMDPD